MRAFLQIAVLAPVLVASFAIPPSSDSEVKGGWTDQDSQVSPRRINSVLAPRDWLTFNLKPFCYL